jgi:hypothetical protein
MTNVKWLIIIGVWLSSVGIAYYKGRSDGITSIKLQTNVATIIAQENAITKTNSDKQIDSNYTALAREQLQELLLKPQIVIVESDCKPSAAIVSRFNNVYGK